MSARLIYVIIILFRISLLLLYPEYVDELVDEDRFEKSSMGTLCNSKNIELQTEDECKIACAELGFSYKGSFNGPGDFPKCQYTEGGNRGCYFNTSPSPGRSDVNSKYSAICAKSLGKRYITTYIFLFKSFN